MSAVIPMFYTRKYRFSLENSVRGNWNITRAGVHVTALQIGNCFPNLLSKIASLISDHYSALARLINLLRRAGKLDECSKYLEQVCVQFFI